ncbi:metal-dependent hydrolase [bacterium]|nr:metal-dependent hydrolase [bacterium]
MFIAHLPAGYLLTRRIQRQSGNHSGALLATGLAASIFPDIDLLYFYLIDRGQTLHHHYITHLPMAWLLAGGLSILSSWMLGMRQTTLVCITILANAMLHMVLDSVAAGILWLYPFSDMELNLVHVPARHGWWVWNFLLHWTFLLELLIILIAFLEWNRHYAQTDPHRG